MLVQYPANFIRVMWHTSSVVFTHAFKIIVVYIYGQCFIISQHRLLSEFGSSQVV